MRPSDIKEKKDQATAWMVTILVHAAILAAMFFVAMPKQQVPAPSIKKIENTVLVNNKAPKA